MVLEVEPTSKAQEVVAGLVLGRTDSPQVDPRPEGRVVGDGLKEEVDPPAAVDRPYGDQEHRVRRQSLQQASSRRALVLVDAEPGGWDRERCHRDMTEGQPVDPPRMP